MSKNIRGHVSPLSLYKNLELEVYIIKPFPILEIIQLPNFYIDHFKLASEFRKSDIMYLYDTRICKSDLEELITLNNFKDIILLKSEHEFLFADISMSKLLELANKVRRRESLKLFW
jgi:hypothetical protein